MNMPKKSIKKKKRIILLKNGSKYEIKSETGKYYICENTQFRKNNISILDIITVQENAE
jgi:hypothetical protein